jgi:hypothetical protein
MVIGVLANKIESKISINDKGESALNNENSTIYEKI